MLCNFLPSPDRRNGSKLCNPSQVQAGGGAKCYVTLSSVLSIGRAKQYATPGQVPSSVRAKYQVHVSQPSQFLAGGKAMYSKFYVTPSQVQAGERSTNMYVSNLEVSQVESTQICRLSVVLHALLYQTSASLEKKTKKKPFLKVL